MQVVPSASAESELVVLAESLYWLRDCTLAQSTAEVTTAGMLPSNTQPTVAPVCSHHTLSMRDF